MDKIEQLLSYLNEADPQDFKDCLVENLEKDSKSYYTMLAEIYFNDKAHFDQLSEGCKAAILIYLEIANYKQSRRLD